MEKDEIAGRVVIIGGSAGSIEVLMKILPFLKGPLSYSLIIVLHRKAGEDMMLEELIAMKSDVPVKELDDKTQLEPGYIYVAPADYHLLFEQGGSLSLDSSEKINYSRPSIDVAFESAAEVYGKHVTAILLSGANADGTNGMIAVQREGGRLVIQSPETAGMPFMPKHAIENIKMREVMDVGQLLSLLNRLT